MASNRAQPPVGTAATLAAPGPIRPAVSATSAAVDWFLPDREWEPLERFRGRLFVTGSVSIALLVAVFSVLYLASPGVTMVQVGSFAFLILPALGFPVLFRYGVSMQVLSGLLVILIQIGLAGSAALDRGIDDVAMLWLVSTPLFAAFVGGPRIGAITAVTAALAAGGLLVAAEQGYTFPELMSPEFARRYHVANLAGAVGFVAVLAWLYEGPISKHLHLLSDNLRVANAELRRELAVRKAAQAEAEAASRAKDALLANLSHEFRTPLTAIMSGAEVLRMGASEEDDQILSSVERGAHRLLATLNGVLDLTRIAGEGARLTAERVEVSGIVHDVATSAQAAAAEKGLRVEVRGVRAWAQADAAALRQLVEALLDNAVRFTEQGGVAVEVEPAGERVIVSVADTGIGMDASFVERAVEPFAQASEGHARTHEGLGLGLTIAQRLAVAMGGRLSIASVAGEGTTVSVTLPAAAAPAERPLAERRPRFAVASGV